MFIHRPPRLLTRSFLFACLIFLSSSAAPVPKSATSNIPVQSSTLAPVTSHRSSTNKCISGEEPKNEKLQHCREYEGNSCCNRQTAFMVTQKIEAVYRTKYAACPACVHNLASLQCAVTCDPRQSNFVVKPVLVQKGRSPRNPVVLLCESFCVSLFRSCGDVDSIDDKGSNSSVTQKYLGRIASGDETDAAKVFCLDLFREFGNHVDATVVQDLSQRSKCYGHTDETWDVCDPYEDQRFWHVVGASMKYNHGLALAMVVMLLLLAAFCVGYNMMLVRKKANWMIARQIKEKSSSYSEQRYPREAGGDGGTGSNAEDGLVEESASFLVRSSEFALQ